MNGVSGMGVTGRLIPNPPAPGSEEWLRSISASKVAAILGLSPYQSRFSLWHLMRGEVQPEAQTDEQSRGHYLEPSVAAWLADQHPDLRMIPGSSWAHADHDWYTASPDRLFLNADDEVVAGVELKSASDTDEWGKAGTDDIPPGYRAQIVAQMDVVGTRITRVGFIGPYLEFREYVVEYDPAEAAFIRGRCEEFLRTVREGIRPDVDSSTATYNTLKRLHPGIKGDDVELPAGLAREYCESRRALKAVEAAHQLQANLVADVVGDARRGLFNGRPVVSRQSRGGAPYLVASRNLPVFDIEEVAA